MKIGLYFHRRLPVRGYGGTERVVMWLAGALARLGHRPVLLTPPGTDPGVAEAAPLPRRAIRRAARDENFALDTCLPTGLDVLHFFSEVRAHTALPRLTTIEGNGSPGSYGAEHVFVSGDHMRRMRGTRFVYNGIDPEEFDFRADKGDYLLFLARASRRVKGVDRAVRIARRTGQRLIIAGGRRFFPSPRIRSVGTVDGLRKRRLLSEARALLFPIRWEEPFGLSVTEALASGTPVLASRRGAMPEIVTPDVGFLCDSDDAFCRALGELDGIDPAACRARVERHFSARVMAEAYLALYQSAIAERAAGAMAGAVR